MSVNGCAWEGVKWVAGKIIQVCIQGSQLNLVKFLN